MKVGVIELQMKLKLSLNDGVGAVLHDGMCDGVCNVVCGMSGGEGDKIECLILSCKGV